MNIVAADWLPYTLTLKTPWETSQGCIAQRKGSLLRLTNADGQWGWGDAAPLPKFGISESDAEAFAEESAHLDLLAQNAGQTLHQWLNGGVPVDSIEVNASIGSLIDATPKIVAKQANAGYRIVKFKVGIGTIDEEIAACRQLAHSAPPSLKLRLDANQAWSFREASLFIAACAELPIEGLEEPLANPEHASLATLQAQCTFPIALDESTSLIDSDFFCHPSVRRLIIKPAREGGLLVSIERALRAKASGIEVIVTSSLESACGLLTCAQLAAAIAPEAVHGLGTADWFADDTGVTPSIIGGRLYLPQVPGIGFKPTGN